jgi:hypothetical protein
VDVEESHFVRQQEGVEGHEYSLHRDTMSALEGSAASPKWVPD